MVNDLDKKYLNDLEVVQLAIDIEDRGYEFYRLAAEKFADDKEKKGFFENLAKEETIHKAKFEELYSHLIDEKKGDDSAYFDIEASIYLRTLFRTSVFPSKDEALKKLDTIKTPYDALELAIRAEKDSILFYDGIIKEAKFDQTKRVATTLMNEEIKHFIDLSNELKKM
ncbi:ferritin family protein [Thermoanaerobacterium sp. RBIITD]|uniref:ferritin-like domain-containing protein n=1 Tax=Thermoanaerobacterium sp. RBIITD TaxID=1550240 RepID=UPI000BB69E6E|nr:ferritin family protein [Thermoanaerobacterium sp. RBIITD]SNX53987.1 Rubrerythrin [Thermoanaerobacterium sp. RBIITD]